jgi:carbohydrate kinase (thermoresistant glucokinase family)
MPFVPGLRSEYSLVGRLVHFGRMLDKIRLHAAGLLPADYHTNLGIGFDGRTCAFLGVDYAALKTRVLAGGCDEDILAWAHEQGGPRSDDQCNTWNRFMMKIGWRDDRTPVLQDRIVRCGLAHIDARQPIETFFDLNDIDEGRDPVGKRSWELKEPRLLLLMGVAGSGKTTVGRALAASLGWRFTDADDFHPPANIAKMSAGAALDDADRAPWLAAVRAHIDARLAARDNTVLACSALKQAYREMLITDPGCVKLIHLTGPVGLLRSRLAQRRGHFATESLLDGQLGDLQPPRAALTLDISAPPDALADSIIRHFSL